VSLRFQNTPQNYSFFPTPPSKIPSQALRNCKKENSTKKLFDYKILFVTLLR
jgi:hypothetical protein